MNPSAKWVVICIACIGAAEGVRTYAYRDPVGIPTICFGETRGVQMGDTATLDQCKDLLASRVQEFGQAVDRCAGSGLPPERKAALTSFAYNVGANAFCSSTLVKKLHRGDTKGACDELLRWNKAKGIPLPGLTARRETERQLCLVGVA